MNLAIFDLDNTLICGDSDHSWGEFLVERGLVDPIAFKNANDQFYEDYKAGTLDIFAYQSFALAPIANKDMATLRELHRAFMAEKIAPLLLEQANEKIAFHKQQGDQLLVITATNRFVAAPIANHLGIDDVLATEPEVVNNQYTGKITGTPCFQDGKITRLQAWLKQQKQTFDKQFFYSDSANDIPLLNEVDFPVAVDPDERLLAHAKSNNWPVLSFRGTQY